MYNYNLVNEGIAIQACGGNVDLILKGYSLEGKEGAKYRQAIYPGLTAWMRKGYIMVEQGLLTADQLKSIQSVVKEDGIKRVKAIRAAHVIQSTAQEAVVIIDELAELKAELKAKSFECNELKQELAETKIELVAEREVSASLFTSLRQLRLNSLVTKVTAVVSQRVGF